MELETKRKKRRKKRNTNKSPSRTAAQRAQQRKMYDNSKRFIIYRQCLMCNVRVLIIIIIVAIAIVAVAAVAIRCVHKCTRFFFRVNVCVCRTRNFHLHYIDVVVAYLFQFLQFFFLSKTKLRDDRAVPYTAPNARFVRVIIIIGRDETCCKQWYKLGATEKWKKMK